jgi:hypothetical protein
MTLQTKDNSHTELQPTYDHIRSVRQLKLHKPTLGRVTKSKGRLGSRRFHTRPRKLNG